jgi:hypothetical protein
MSICWKFFSGRRRSSIRAGTGLAYHNNLLEVGSWNLGTRPLLTDITTMSCTKIQFTIQQGIPDALLSSRNIDASYRGNDLVEYRKHRDLQPFALIQYWNGGSIARGTKM